MTDKYLLYNPDDFKNVQIKPDTTREELEALRAENARLLKKNTALKAALEETYKIASRNEDGEYKWQVIKALSEKDYD